jgi:NAD(P)-dependent dehydrogenase (short-subunit alcohol dehydrogenase family)
MKDFTAKVAVITGGASGVGRSLAFALGRRGAKIVIGDVDAAAMELVSADLAAEGIAATVSHCDVTDIESLNALAATAQSVFGGVHLVFANAGIGAGEAGAIWDYPEKDWQWCFNVNIWGVINSIRAFMPVLIAQGEPAHFVVTGSGNGGLVIYPDQPIYTASKAAVHTITENLHYQVQAGGLPIKVSALFPGPHVVDTGLFNSGRVRPESLKTGVDGNATGINSVDDMKKMAAEYGIEMQTTHPDEVAEMALQGLETDAFWLLKTTPETDAMIQARTEMIMSRTTPTTERSGF